MSLPESNLPGPGHLDRRTGHLAGVTPDGAVYRDESTFRAEMEGLFSRHWLCIAHEQQLPRPGDYLTRQVGPEGLLFVRDREGEIHGFYNFCRHRGTQLLEAASGTGLRSIVCPYHAWSYSLDGKLTGAPHMQGVEGFRKEDNGLVPVRIERWGGFLWANLDDAAPPLDHQLGAFFDRLKRFPIAELKLADRREYDVAANWKLLVENYSECYHCAPIHPELNRITPYFTGENDAYFLDQAPRGKFSGGFMTFAKDYTSMTVTGYTRRPPLRGMTEEDRKRIYYYVVFPNMFFSLHPDYLMVHRTWPIAPDRSRIETDFFFEPETMARPDFDPSDAVEIWDTINKQDWRAVELAQKGTRSRRWHGGRYSEQESMVHDFDAYVLAETKRP